MAKSYIVHPKVMSAPTNVSYYFLASRTFFCLFPDVKMLHSAPLKPFVYICIVNIAEKQACILRCSF